MKSNRIYTLKYLGIVLFSLLFQRCEKEQYSPLIFPNCEEEQQSPDQPSKIQFLDPWYLGSCFAKIYFEEYPSLVIKDYSSYIQFGISNRGSGGANSDCSTAELPYVDFDNYFLVARRTWGGGCSVKYFRNIEIDNTSKTLVYNIEVYYYGLCKMGISNFNWVLIPKRYSEYNLQYDVKETNVLDQNR